MDTTTQVVASDCRKIKDDQEIEERPERTALPNAIPIFGALKRADFANAYDHASN
jgi:hypothetical protein